MPLNGGGTASRVPGTSAAPNTTIRSADYEASMDDIYQILNTAPSSRASLATPGLNTANAFTKTQTWAKGADVASASTLTLGDDGNYFDITGTTTITAIATKGVGTVVKLHFDASLTLTHHATDLVLPGGANIITAAGDEFEFTEYATGDWRCTGYALASGNSTTGVALSAVPDFVQGLTLSNNGTDANNDIDISTGSAKGNSKSVTNGSTMTKRLDASWASGTGNGGLDTGTKANSTTYHVHAIVNNTTAAFDALFSTSATAPTVPSGWTLIQRLGSVMTDGSGNIRGFVQDEKTFLLKTPLLDVSVTNQSTTAVSRTLTAPSGIQVDAIISGVIYNGGAPTAAIISALDTNDTAPAANGLLTVSTSSTDSYGSFQLRVKTSTSAQIRTRASAASTHIYLTTSGWVDTSILRL